MTRSRRRAVLAIALTLTIGACTSVDAGSKDVVERSRPTTTTSTTTTTTLPPAAHFILDVLMEGDQEALSAVAAFYGWIGDRTLGVPDVPGGLLDLIEPIRPHDHMTISATLHAADLDEGRRVGIVTADDDILLLADDGGGWSIVGASLPRFDAGPWYGEPIRHVLVIGTDARPGESQPVFRADGIHILSSNLTERRGGIVNIPRDAHVQASYGMDKFSSVNARSERHSDEMLDIARDLSGLPVEGYILTGFLGFIRLVDQFGGVMINVPYRMNDWRAEADLYAGLQRLFGANALAFSRIRSIPGGDFTRTGHHGVVMLAALAEIVDRDITQLPELVAILDRNTWTDLALGDLLTLAAVGFELRPEDIPNVVLPGTVRMVRGASVVVLDAERSEAIFRDLDDGMLTPSQ
jgi:polyisoprenyl-teichoic acid--peptidoglycan teichoic acid transferase